MNNHKMFQIKQEKLAAENAINAAQWDLARSILSQIVQVDDSDYTVWYQLGYCQMMLNNLKESIGCLQRSIEINSNFEHSYIILSNVQFRNNDIVRAIETLQHLIELFPESSEGYSLLGGAYMQNSQALEAEDSFIKSLNIHAEQNNTRLHLGKLQIQLHKFESAIKNLMEVLNSGKFTGEAHNYLANAYQNIGDFDQAITHYKSAIKVMPGINDPAINLGIIYEKHNRLDEAKYLAEEVLKSDSTNFGANLLCSRIEKRNKNYIKAKQCLENALSVKSNYSHYSTAMSELGNVLDKLKLYDEAYQSFTKANNVLLDVLNTTLVDLDEYIQDIRVYQKWFSSNSVNTPQSSFNVDDINDPIFFVGFPRSGTTLMEKMLESHPELVSSHEEVLIGEIVGNISTILERQVNLPQDLNSISNEEIMKLRSFYMESVKNIIGHDIRNIKFVDKLPLNIINLGVISRIFPNAHIIVAIRDPRDCCFSCFAQAFDMNRAMANFLTLEKTTSLYIEVMELFQIYKDNIKLKIFEYKYEDLVDDTAGISKQLFEFIGIEWDEKVLKYYDDSKHKYVNTPSYQAITQPIYTEAVSRWKNYEKFITPYHDRLRPYIHKFGYSDL